MDHYLYEIKDNTLNDMMDSIDNTITDALESGRVVYLPNYAFHLQDHEQCLLSPTLLDGHHKNISYDHLNKRLGSVGESADRALVQSMMERYALFSHGLIQTLFPSYCHALKWGRTSYRPAEVNGRQTSKRKDDTRLHVDAFPATPVHGQRILRVFSNVNPQGLPRVWHLGEPFSKVFERFSPRIPQYKAWKAACLKLIKVTKTFRSHYDHCMLNTHDMMKLDDNYQSSVEKYRFDFPAFSTWIVFTDHVSHAALSGQYLLEQTFYLPSSAMNNTKHAPSTYWSNVG